MNNLVLYELYVCVGRYREEPVNILIHPGHSYLKEIESNATGFLVLSVKTFHLSSKRLHQFVLV